MKRIVLSLVTLLFGCAAGTFAQSTVDTQACLLKEYKQADLDAMSADEKGYLEFYVENAVKVYDIPEDKPTDIYPTKKWVVESDVCIYDLKVKTQESQRVNFFSKNEKLVIIFSEEELKKNYERKK